MINTGENINFAGRYLLKRHIGDGGFAEVWLAEDQQANGTLEVLKIYSPGKRMDTSGIETFRREYAIVQRLLHPNLLRPKHLGVIDGHPYLVMDYCKEGNLYNMFQSKGGNLPENEIAEIMHQIGGALGYLHKNGIAHQDIKPDNILIFAPGKYLLSDFGVSTKIKRETIHNTNTRRTTLSLEEMELQQERYTYITPAYASPEAFDGKGNTPESDIFSFGLMLYELANGTLPYTPPSYTGEVVKSGGEIPDLPQKFSPELNGIIQTCIDLEPSDRLDAQTLYELGEGYLKDGKWPVQFEGAEPEPEPEPRPSRKQPAKGRSAPKKERESVREKRKPEPEVVEEYYEGDEYEEAVPFWRKPVVLIIGLVLLLGGGGYGAYEAFMKPVPCPPMEGISGYTGEVGKNCEPVGTVEDASVSYINDEGKVTATYNGSLKDGKRDGQGKIEFNIEENSVSFTETYEGGFKNDKMHGDGEYIFSDGSRYIGEFDNGIIRGEGTFIDAKANDTVVGSWDYGELLN